MPSCGRIVHLIHGGCQMFLHHVLRLDSSSFELVSMLVRTYKRNLMLKLANIGNEKVRNGFTMYLTKSRVCI